MRRKKKKNTSKKLFFLILLIGILIFYCINYLFKDDNILKITEDKQGVISDYYVYGNHLNMTGSINIDSIDNSSEVFLILKSKNKEIKLNSNIDIENNKVSFNLSDKINDGFNLDSLTKGKYYLLLKVENDEKNKYYSFEVNDDLGDLTYYTVTKSNTNYKIDIKKEQVLLINCKKSSLPDDVYDITIDAGHGDVDTGSSYTLNGKTYYEADLTLLVAKSLKKELEEEGFKVLMTRDKKKNLDYYNDSGRAVLSNKFHTKLTISIHLNSEEGKMNYGGVEVYTPNDIDYSLAKDLASNIVKKASTTYSLKQSDQVLDGVYYSYFTSSDINESYEESLANGYEPYDIKPYTPTMYMIREVGGKATMAYVDNRNLEIGYNPYYDSRITSESYLIELGYISYSKDLKNIINNYDLYAKGISDVIVENYS